AHIIFDFIFLSSWNELERGETPQRSARHDEPSPGNRMVNCTPTSRFYVSPVIFDAGRQRLPSAAIPVAMSHYATSTGINTRRSGRCGKSRSDASREAEDRNDHRSALVDGAPSLSSPFAREPSRACEGADGPPRRRDGRSGRARLHHQADRSEALPLRGGGAHL